VAKKRKSIMSDATTTNLLSLALIKIGIIPEKWTGQITIRLTDGGINWIEKSEDKIKRLALRRLRASKLLDETNK
jgi:hypothetical protein